MRPGAPGRWRAVLAVLLAVHLAALYWPRVTVTGPVLWTDKAAHLLLFALPAAAGLLARVRPAYLLVPLAAHAPVSEALQHLVLPRRSGDLADVAADLTGVVVGAAAALVIRARSRW